MDNSHLHGRNSRRFSETVIYSAKHCAADVQKTFINMDGTPANFSMQFLRSQGTVRPSCFGKIDLHGRNSRHLFLRTFWSAFAVPPYMQITRRNALYDFSVNKNTFCLLILRSFSGFKIIRYFNGPIPSLWDQSGIQGPLTS